MTFSIAHLSMGEFWSGSPTYSKEARSGLGNLTMGEFYSSSRTQAIWVRVGEYDVSHMLANKTPPLCCQMGALLNLFCYSFSEKIVSTQPCLEIRPHPSAVRWGICWIFFYSFSEKIVSSQLYARKQDPSPLLSDRGLVESFLLFLLWKK